MHSTANYMKKSVVVPLNSIPNPSVGFEIWSWSMVGRGMIAGYCKNKQNEQHESYAYLYTQGEIGFTEAMSPVKFLNPARAVDTVARAWTFSVTKEVADKHGYGAAVPNPKAKGVARVYIGLFTAPPQLIRAVVGPIANLDTIPKCI